MKLLNDKCEYVLKTCLDNSKNYIVHEKML